LPKQTLFVNLLALKIKVLL